MFSVFSTIGSWFSGSSNSETSPPSASTEKPKYDRAPTYFDADDLIGSAFYQGDLNLEQETRTDTSEGKEKEEKVESSPKTRKIVALTDRNNVLEEEIKRLKEVAAAQKQITSEQDNSITTSSSSGAGISEAAIQEQLETTQRELLEEERRHKETQDRLEKLKSQALELAGIVTDVEKDFDKAKADCKKAQDELQLSLKKIEELTSEVRVLRSRLDGQGLILNQPNVLVVEGGAWLEGLKMRQHKGNGAIVFQEGVENGHPNGVSPVKNGSVVSRKVLGSASGLGSPGNGLY